MRAPPRACRLALALGLASAAPGCLASWATVQITDNAQLLDERVREERVPLPGVREQLRVALPLGVRHTTTTGTVVRTDPSPAQGVGAALPFALACEVVQTGRDTVYKSAYRYGKGWKKATATMFILEVAAAAVLYLDSGDKPLYEPLAAVLALDALGAAVLFFAPRKEIYRHTERPVTTHVRSDCPEGLALDIGGDVFPVDAAGRIGEVGEVALDAWMRAQEVPLRVLLGARMAELPVVAADACTWHRSHHPAEPAPGCGAVTAPRTHVGAALEVPLGTLTRAP